MTDIEKEIIPFNEIILLINDKYLVFLNNLLEKFKYHSELVGQLEFDIKFINTKLEDNNNYIINHITNNFLYCLEQLYDNNYDYFIYQKETIIKKNKKFIKNKLPNIGNKTLFKKILKESNKNNVNNIFESIIELFNLLITKDENNVSVFNSEYIEYIKENFSENKNFGKMIIVINNIDTLLNNKLNEEIIQSEDKELIESENINENKSKKNKKNKKKDKSNGMDFMKGLEGTKIAQLAKNISEKINIEDFPSLNDPSKLLSSLGNPSEEGGIQNLLKFVIDEVQGAFKDNNLNENDLVNEAQDIMGKFKNMSGFDPMSMLNNENIDMSKFADMFQNMNKK